MIESRINSQSADSSFDMTSMIQDALKTTVAYQHLMARYLFESTCLDGLEKLPIQGSLPASFLGYFKKVMELFDESTRACLSQFRDAGLTAQCQSECPHCCYQMPTGVSVAELIFLYHGMQQSGAASRFFRRCLEAEELWVEVLHQHTNENTMPGDCRNLAALMPKFYHDLEPRCPFLDTRLCQIYPYRPFACRMHFSLTPPHWCRPSHFQNTHALGFNLEPGKRVLDALEKLDNRFQLDLSDVMVCGLLELTVNVMKFRKIQWS
jgi:Fe-S-cluster containining protein